MTAGSWEGGGKGEDEEGEGGGLGVGEVAWRAPVPLPAPAWVRYGLEFYLPRRRQLSYPPLFRFLVLFLAVSVSPVLSSYTVQARDLVSVCVCLSCINALCT